MKRYMAWMLALLFYISVLPWNMAGAEYFNINARNLVVSESPWVDVRAYLAIPDDGIEDSVNIQRSIDNAALGGGGDVLVSDGVWDVANLQLKSNVRIICTEGAELKLVDNAALASHNGGLLGASGIYYPANVIGTTLNDKGAYMGGTMFDSGVRAIDPSNSVYIVDNAAVIGCRINGNHENNTVGDLGSNASAMQAGISLHQAHNVTLRGNKIRNVALDGISVGYSNHGGSDYNIIDGNFIDNVGRNAMSIMTGKGNLIINNTDTNCVGGIDVEANITGEINYKHKIIGNTTEGIGLTSSNASVIQNDLIVQGNIVHGVLTIGSPEMIGGTIISGNRFIAATDNDIWVNFGEAYNQSTTPKRIIFDGNTVTGYKFASKYSLAGGGAGTMYRMFSNNYISSQFGFYLNRPYGVEIINNTLVMTGGDNTYPAISIVYGQVTGVPYQGKVLIKGNTVSGSGVNGFLEVGSGVDPPLYMTKDDLIVEGNKVELTVGGSWYFSNLAFDSSWYRNILLGLTTNINVSKAFSSSIFKDNYISGSLTPGTALFTGTQLFDNTIIEGNTIKGMNLEIYRIRNSNVSRNNIWGGGLRVDYYYTTGDAGGGNVFSGNVIHADNTASVDYPIRFVAGTGYTEGDIAVNDEVFNNLYYGTFANSVTLLSTQNYKYEYNKTPASAAESCIKGETAWDNTYRYQCIATDNWVRGGMAGW